MRRALATTLRTAAVVLATLPGLARAAPIGLPGFPVHVDGVIRTSPVIADLDGDGQNELVVEAEGRITIFDADGSIKAGPFDLGPLAKRAGAVPVGAIAVGDLDGDGKAELGLSFSFGDVGDGAVVVVHWDGTSLWPEPLAVPRGPGAGPTFADVDGDGKLDVVVGARDGRLYAVNGQKKALHGFPVKLSGSLESAVSFGGLVRGGKPALAVGTDQGRLYAVTTDGKIAPGFPVQTKFAISGAPAFGDVDDDGEHELVVASQDFAAYVFNADGSLVGGGLPVPAFPQATGYRLYGGPALADLDRDGALDVVVGSGDGKIYAWNSHGKNIPGFPVSAGSRVTQAVVVGDGDRDGFDEIFAASDDGSLYAFDRHGRAVDGFPVHVAGQLLAAPVLGDLVKDPSVELVVGAPDGSVHGWRLDRTGQVAMSPLSWPAESHDAARQGHFGPNPPRYRHVRLGPDHVRAGEAISLGYDFYDLDGDPEPKTLVRWTVDGRPVPELDGKRTVPADRVKKNQRWQAVVQSPEDFAAYKAGPGAQLNPSNELVVEDTPPTAPKIAISPATPKVTDTLSAVLLAPATDVDGDRVLYRYHWFRDGEPASDQATVPGSTLHKGERWRVQLVPTDGTLDGPPVEAETTVVDSLPTAPQIALSPATPTIEDDVRVSIAKASTDADGDELAYRYAFYVNGERQALPPDRALWPKEGARKGDTVTVEAWAVDGELAGPRAKAEVKLVDAPPTAPTAAIAPASPTTSDDLTAGIARAARDPDGDAVGYRVRWFRNGQPFGEPGALVVPASATTKHDTWAVELVPNDGAKDGPAAKAEVTIANSPPTRPRLSIDRRAPAVDESATISIAEPATDPDGDAISYEWNWTADGQPMPAAKGQTTLAAGAFHKGQRFVVTVTPVDAEGAKGPAATMEIRPRNSPPGAPVVKLEPAHPTTETGLHATIATPAPDKDGDALTYRYRWFRNGVLATDVGNRSALEPGEIARGDEWRVVAVAFDGESEGPGAEARAVVENVAPVAPQISLLPPHPTVVTGLSCDVTTPATDADHDPLVLDYRWSRDGRPFWAPSSLAAIPGDALKTGETWKCEVVAKDGRASSPVASATATVEDAAPNAPEVAVSPASPKAGEDLTCAVVREAQDPDHDRVSYRYSWRPPEGVSLGELADPAVVPGKFVKKGQAWRCLATTSDGRLSVDAESPVVTVGNTPPKAPRLKLVPATAEAGTELRCDFAEPAVDLDGDAVSYAFAWFKNGRRQSFAETSAAVPGRLVRAGDRWRCQATALDADGPGGVAKSLEVTIAGAVAGAD